MRVYVYRWVYVQCHPPKGRGKKDPILSVCLSPPQLSSAKIRSLRCACSRPLPKQANRQSLSQYLFNFHKWERVIEIIFSFVCVGRTLFVSAYLWFHVVLSLVWCVCLEFNGASLLPPHCFLFHPSEFSFLRVSFLSFTFLKPLFNHTSCSIASSFTSYVHFSHEAVSFYAVAPSRTTLSLWV